MKYLKFLLFLLHFVLPLAASAGGVQSLKENDSIPGYIPKEGFIPNSKTAVAVATAVLIPIYGEKEVSDKKPFIAKLRLDKWIVTGTLPKNMAGGVPEVHISKSSGKILKVSAGK